MNSKAEERHLFFIVMKYKLQLYENDTQEKWEIFG